MSYKGVESYLHRYAKQTVGSWLRGRVRVGQNFKGLQPILASVPFGMPQPMCGVYEEYPVTTSNIGLQRVCESGNCECLTGWHCPGGTATTQRNGIPTVKELIAAKIPVEFIFDVGVVDTSGRLCCVVEICHTNPISDEKIKWLNDHEIDWFEMSAEWIMQQVKSPFNVADGIIKSKTNLKN